MIRSIVRFWEVVNCMVIQVRTILCTTKTYFPPEPKTDTTAQLEKRFFQPTRSVGRFLQPTRSEYNTLRYGKRGFYCFYIGINTR
jgi:hypothetical protein